MKIIRRFVGAALVAAAALFFLIAFQMGIILVVPFLLVAAGLYLLNDHNFRQRQGNVVEEAKLSGSWSLTDFSWVLIAASVLFAVLEFAVFRGRHPEIVYFAIVGVAFIGLVLGVVGAIKSLTKKRSSASSLVRSVGSFRLSWTHQCRHLLAQHSRKAGVDVNFAGGGMVLELTRAFGVGELIARANPRLPNAKAVTLDCKCLGRPLCRRCAGRVRSTTSTEVRVASNSQRGWPLEARYVGL